MEKSQNLETKSAFMQKKKKKITKDKQKILRNITNIIT